MLEYRLQNWIDNGYTIEFVTELENQIKSQLVVWDINPDVWECRVHFLPIGDLHPFNDSAFATLKHKTLSKARMLVDNIAFDQITGRVLSHDRIVLI